VGFAVAFVGADGAGTAWYWGGVGLGSAVVGGRFHGQGAVEVCRCDAFELAEDGFVVGENVAEEAVAVLFAECDGGFHAGSEDAWGDDLGELSGVCLIGGCEVDQTYEMAGDSV